MSFTSPEAVTQTRWRDVWIAAGTNLVTGLGTFLVMTTLILAMQEEGHGGLAVSGVIIGEALPMVVLASLTGRLADRIDSRKLLLVAGAIQVAACWGLSLASGFGPRVALLLVIACGTAVIMPTRQALMMTMATREDLPRTSGISSTASQIGAIGGPALAGFAQGSLGTSVTMKVAAVAFGATIVAGLAFRTRRGGVASVAHEEAAAGGQVRMDSLLRTLTVAFAVVIAAVSAVNVVDVFFVKATLGASSSAYGLITSMWTVGMIAGTWIVARTLKRADDGRIAVQSMATLAATCTMVIITSTVTAVWPMVGLFLIGGMINGAINVQIFTLFGRRVPAHARGRISARLNASVQGAALLGYAAGGAALEGWTPRTVLASAGVAGMLAVAVVLPMVLAAARTDRAAQREAQDGAAALATVDA